MLRSDKCHLYQKSEYEMNRMKECFHDPGGYFVVKGQEKVWYVLIISLFSVGKLFQYLEEAFV